MFFLDKGTAAEETVQFKCGSVYKVNRIESKELHSPSLADNYYSSHSTL